MTRLSTLTFGQALLLFCIALFIAAVLIKLFFKTDQKLEGQQLVALRNAANTALPRALFLASPQAFLTVLVSVLLVGWAFHRVRVTLHSELDSTLVWVFNAIFLGVVVQLILAYSDRPIVGGNTEHMRTAILVPLYNEDPEVVKQVLTSFFKQRKRPDEVHIVDDESTESDYSDEKSWFLDRAQEYGIRATWQRTPNQGKRHAQVTAFERIGKDIEYFITVDSDFILDSEAIEQICRPFTNPRIQSVAGVILAKNNLTNLLARITDLIFVTQQLIDRSSLSQVGSVLVNSGGLACYRREVLSKANIRRYLNETYFGKPVEFSDDSMLTLFALAKGKTVQQLSAFAFAFMPDRLGHHYRQQVRWFRGSFIRGLWRTRFLPMASIGFWRQILGWVQLGVVVSVLVYLVIWRPLVEGAPIPPEAILIPILIGYAQGARYLMIWRTDTPVWQQYLSVIASPLATFWVGFYLRPLRLWGIITSGKLGWNTRAAVEVTAEPAGGVTA